MKKTDDMTPNGIGALREIARHAQSVIENLRHDCEKCCRKTGIPLDNWSDFLSIDQRALLIALVACQEEVEGG